MVKVVKWPNTPPVPTALQKTIPSYLYVEYQDDDYLQAMVDAYNQFTQAYLDYFNTIGLPIYTGMNIVGPLLDWVAAGLYGIQRPVLPSGDNDNIGPLNTYQYNFLPLNTIKNIGPQNVYYTTDDIFKRIITWHFYKGDGKVFSIRWLKRRLLRFMFGINGGDYIIDQTYPISVALSGSVVTITMTVDPTLPVLPILHAAINSGVLELPFQFTYVFNY